MSQPTLTEKQLVPLTFPVEFLRNTLLYDGSDLVTEWLRKNAPEPVNDLFNAIVWLHSVETQLHQGDGKIDPDVNKDSFLIVPGALHACEKLKAMRRTLTPALSQREREKIGE